VVGSLNGVRNRLGLLCDQLTRHRTMTEEIEAAGAGPHLRELLRLVREGSGTATEGTREKELLDAIEDACARRGLSALEVREFGDVRLPPGFEHGAPSSGGAGPNAWVCPWGRCGRVVFPDETPAPPDCAAGGEPLRPFPPG
jgi:hypothetical protein